MCSSVLKKPNPVADICCAIYTRKSTEEGLEQDFNSLDAQREACAAFIASQKHEGWKALSESYDDGGFSGGNTNRPALQQLMADIKAGKVNTIVVYKIDRLTRSLADFAKMVEVFDQYKVSFVSVTQQFNTTTSMGRLTLNVLLSFAQFEREVTGERIRDKIAASKAKGMWMGGSIPLGYTVVEKRLTPAPEEVPIIQHIFKRYIALGSIPQLRSEMAQSGYLSRSGKRFSIGILANILTNPVYIGQTRHRDKVFQGQHTAIVGLDVWEQVQELRRTSRLRHTHRVRAKETSLLAGKLLDAEGHPMSAAHANKSGRRYRYYVSQGLLQDTLKNPETVCRIPAGEIEQHVELQIRGILSDDTQLLKILSAATLAQRTQAQDIAQNWLVMGRAERHILIRQLLISVRLTATAVEIDIGVESLGALLCGEDPQIPSANVFTLTLPVQIKPVAGGATYILGPAEKSPSRLPNDTLVQAIAKAHYWNHLLVSGQVASQNDLIATHKLDPRHFRRMLPLAWLAPDIVRAILARRQPEGLTLANLYKAHPWDWVQQCESLGIKPHRA